MEGWPANKMSTIIVTETEKLKFNTWFDILLGCPVWIGHIKR
jgi:hypothetical protein